MGRALGLWLLGVPVFVIILLYLFQVMEESGAAGLVPQVASCWAAA